MERFSVRGILSVIGGCLPIREMRYNALNGWDRAATPLRSGFSAPPYLSPHKPLEGILSYLWKNRCRPLVNR
jgi:hypothetical protein